MAARPTATISTMSVVRYAMVILLG
jgi:hypothetical protein